jgi:hypothetical protein
MSTPISPPGARTFTPILERNAYVLVPGNTTTGNLSSGGNLSVAGNVGDVLAGLTIIPVTTSPGDVQIKDGSNTAITIFSGGSSSLAALGPVDVDTHGAVSVTGGWQISTGGNITALAYGVFT